MTHHGPDLLGGDGGAAHFRQCMIERGCQVERGVGQRAVQVEDDDVEPDLTHKTGRIAGSRAVEG